MMTRGPFRAALCAVGVAAALSTDAGARHDAGQPEGGTHSISIGGNCEVVVCRDDALRCEVAVRYNDDFGDTTEIVEAYLIVYTKQGLTRVPETGSLSVVEFFGNTTAEIGAAPPVLIGPSLSTLSGLPGNSNDGAVFFGDGGFVPAESDPEPILVELWAVYRDLCDDPGAPPGCYDDLQGAVAGWATDIFRPAITLVTSVDQSNVCPLSELTYTYEVENPGNVAFDVTLMDDPPCDFPVFIGGDVMPPNGLLDPGEVWMYECVAEVTQTTTTRAVATGDVPGFPDCIAEAEAETTVVVNPACAEDITGDCIVGFADVLHLLANWGPCPPKGECPADLDLSGDVDFADVLIVLTTWGPCA